MSSYGIRLKVKCQGFSIETVTRELVKLYSEIEDQFKAKGVHNSSSSVKEWS